MKGGVEEVGGVALALALALALMQVEAKRAHRVLTPLFSLSLQGSKFFIFGVKLNFLGLGVLSLVVRCKVPRLRGSVPAPRHLALKGLFPRVLSLVGL